MAQFDAKTIIEEYRQEMMTKYGQFLPKDDPYFFMIEWELKFAEALSSEHEHIAAMYDASIKKANENYIARQEQAQNDFSQSLVNLQSKWREVVEKQFKEALIEAMRKATEKANKNVAEQFKQELGTTLQQNKLLTKLNMVSVGLLIITALLIAWIN